MILISYLLPKSAKHKCRQTDQNLQSKYSSVSFVMASNLLLLANFPQFLFFVWAQIAKNKRIQQCVGSWHASNHKALITFIQEWIWPMWNVKYYMKSILWDFKRVRAREIYWCRAQGTQLLHPTQLSRKNTRTIIMPNADMQSFELFRLDRISAHWGYKIIGVCVVSLLFEKKKKNKRNV